MPEALHRLFEDAFNRHDVEAVASLYEGDAVLMRGDGSLRGIEAIRAAYRSYFAAKPRIELRTVSVERAGELAMLRGRWVLVETGPDGGQVRREGRNMEVARLGADGRWRFAIDDPGEGLE